MLTHLFFKNIHFTVKVLAALVFFATGWLHHGSWKLEKKGKSFLVRSFGFFFLSIVAIGQAASVDFPPIIFSFQIIKILGLITILVSLIIEPILRPPKKEATAISLLLVSQSLIPLSAVLYLIVALTYLRKSTEGLEKQIRPMFFAFLLLSASEFVNISTLAQNSQVLFWSNLLTEFGPAWIMAHVLELIAVLIMGVWTWGYIRFRARAQLFIIFITSSLLIFTLTTFSFTFLLLKNIESDALAHLKTDVKVLKYAVDGLKSEALADAKVVSENSTVKKAISEGDSEKLYKATLEFMLSQNTSFLDIATASGKVLMRSSDKEKIGDSLSEDPIVKSAIDGNPLSAIAVREQVIAPVVQVRASAPIYSDGALMGIVVTGFDIDSAFVDGVKSATGLDTSVYAGNTRAATTFVSTDGKTRFIGSKETNDNVLAAVLENGETFIAPLQVLNQPFYTAYAPLKSTDDSVVGMLFVGKLQTEIFATAQRSIQLTFAGSVILMVLSTIPAFFVARYIKENLKA
jgi:hypothetical protein